MAQKRHILIIIPTLGERIEYLAESILSIKNNPGNSEIDIIVSSPMELYGVQEQFKNVSNISFDVRSGTKEKVINEIVKENRHYKYFNWLGDDDRLSENSLLNLSKILDVNLEVNLIYGDVRYIDEFGEYIFTNKLTAKFGKFLYWLVPGIVKIEGGLIRVEDFILVGGLEENPDHGSPDIDITFKLVNKGRLLHLNQEVADFRIHNGSNTTSDRKRQIRQAHILQLNYLHGVPKLINVFLYPIINITLRSVTKLLGK